MVFSDEGTFVRAHDLKLEIENPPQINQGDGEKFINRSTGSTGSDGLYYFNWSTAGHSYGWYTFGALGVISLYKNGFDYQFFQVTPDITKPNVSLVSPQGWLDYNDVFFIYNVTDNNPNIANCTLILDNEINYTNHSINDNGRNNFTILSLPEKQIDWSVNCSDAAGNVQNSTTFSIIIDITDPHIALNYPDDDDIFDDSNINFNFTPTDNLASNLTCALYIDGSLNHTVNTTNSTPTNISVNDISEGIHSWYVICTDQAGNNNQSVTKSFTIDYSPPEISLVSPPDGHWNKTGNITFIYIPNDVVGIHNCSLIINNEINDTNSSSLILAASNEFNLSNLTEGIYNWSINCTDLAGRQGNSSTWTLYVDKTKPYVNLTGPGNGFTSTIRSVDLNFSVYDNMYTILECNVTINNSINNTSPIAVTAGNPESHSVPHFGDGFFLWNVTCWDSIHIIIY
jgi:hypothetical protein